MTNRKNYDLGKSIRVNVQVSTQVENFNKMVLYCAVRQRVEKKYQDYSME